MKIHKGFLFLRTCTQQRFSLKYKNAIFFFHPACKTQVYCISHRASERHMPHADVFFSTM